MGSISALLPCITSSPHLQAIVPQHYFLINILPQFDLNIDTSYNICLWEKKSNFNMQTFIYIIQKWRK